MSMSEALAEAYASSPVDELVYDTIELHHPTFVDEYGVRTAVRVVQGFNDIVAKLESTAPLNADEYITFLAIPFTLTREGFSENDVPALAFAISNANRLVTKYLEQAIEQTDPIVMIYRPYLESDLSVPQINPVITMELTSAEAGLTQITATANLSDVHNWPFPYVRYTPELFPGLVR